MVGRSRVVGEFNMVRVQGIVESVRGRLKRSARAVQLFGPLAVLETHALRY